MVKSIFIKFVLFLILPFGVYSQKLVYKFKSKVEIRDWKLSSRAYKEVTYFEGASIEVFEGTKLITKTTSEKDGNFTVDLPPSGNYTMVVTGAGYNTRRYSVNCNSIVIKNGNEDFIPSVDVTGFIATKVIKGNRDMGLSNPIVQMANDKNEELKYNGLNFPVNVVDGDIREIQKFCTCNKLGDEAVRNKNYTLAQNYYQMASNLKADEEYPKEQMKRVEEKMKEEMLAEKDRLRSKSKGAVTKNKKKVNTPVTATPQYNSNQKSSSGGHKVLPVIGGKK